MDEIIRRAAHPRDTAPDGTPDQDPAARRAGDRAGPGRRPHAAAPVVPGFTVGRRLGRGAHASVWEAVEDGTGTRYALKVRAGSDAAQALDREAAVLRRVRHEHLVTVHRVVDLADGRRALVLDVADGGSVADVLDRCGLLTPGQVVSLLVPLARALGFLHARGLVHGDVAPANVLLTADGRPLLADLGTVRVLGTAPDEALGHVGFVAPEVLAGGAASPASDVHALGALGETVLAPGSGAEHRAVREVLAALLAPDPARRPDAGDAARALFAAARARPLPVAPAREGHDVSADVTRRVRVAALETLAESPPPGRGLRRAAGAVVRAVRAVRAALRRRAVPVLLAVVALAVGVPVVGLPVVGLLTAPPGPARAEGVVATAGAPSPEPVPPDDRMVGPLRAFPVLVDRRASALGSADPDTLAGVTVAGSPAARADASLLTTMAEAGVRLDGLGYDVSGVRLLRTGPGTAVVEATITTQAHRRVGPDGTVLAEVARAAPEHVEVELAAAPQAPGWLVSAVRPARVSPAGPPTPRPRPASGA